MQKIISVIGARPQFIKAVMVSRAIKEFNKKCNDRNSKIKEIIVHTGQHYDYDMNDIFFKELKIDPPDYNLRVGSRSHGRQTAMMLEGIEAVLKEEAPDSVLVYGDTNSTLAGALAAKKLHILLAHVEAGLRSYNMDMPEEINRVLVDRISDVLFCPSKNAVRNLYSEGIANSNSRKFPKVFLVGDVMYDSVLFHFDIAKKKSAILRKLSLFPKSYYLATIHRAENTDNRRRLKSLLESLNDIAKNRAPVIFPVHPRTKKAISSLRIRALAKSLKMIEPVSYLDMLLLEKNAKTILTDSGGVQKESYFLKVPCVTLRDETEWQETVDGGFNILTGSDKEKIAETLNTIEKLNIKSVRFYGDGKASRKIIRIIKSMFVN
ncbi:MAG: UDP-N-acetylglucosamine 2-epimerase [Omnitrophica WOR_2 bacterium SM23_29]|nr:MAG: UDP-N-acetylglucosamine 2-epimerase [Omnitrophica WOR_2 bacterium SM23_29]